MARDAAKLQALSTELGEEGILFDAADFDSVETAIQAALARAGRIDGLVNCAGSLLLKPAHLTTASEFRATVAANLDSAFAIVRAARKP